MKILFEDEHLVAIDKPAGLLVHRSELDNRETNFALQQLRDLIGTFVYPIHRLDKPTSGVLLFAKHSEAAARVSEQLRSGEVSKSYLAVLRGYSKEEQEIDYPLRKIIDRFGKPSYKSDEEQECHTSLKRLATMELPISIDKYPTSRYSLVFLQPHTGRRHQLRRHMKHISHPIIGDPKYGKSVHNNYFKEHLQVERLLLASVGLQFSHPYSGEEITITQLPEDSFASLFPLFHFPTEEFILPKRVHHKKA